MKNLFFVFFFSVLMLQVSAQTSKTQTAPNDALAKELTEKITVKYTLNAEQAKKIYEIQARKQRNMEQIATLQSENPKLYLAKIESIQNGTLASIKRTLKTKEQMDIFNKTMAETRNKKAEKRKELMKSSANKDAIEAAMVEIYFE
jgi:transposase-like protein